MAQRIIIVTNYGHEETPESEMMQGLLTAQDRKGQITWQTLTPTIAVGTINELDGENARIAVIDTENADALDTLNTGFWVAGVSDEYPVEV